MDEVVIFIVTTFYNSKNVLSKTLDSLLLQTKTNFIHYLYDDCSSDDSDYLIREYMSRVNKLKRPFKVIYEKGKRNLGCDKAHEHAFKRLSGTHLMWLDAGDYLDTEFIEIVTKTIVTQKRFSWFHVDSIHYDLITGKNIGKKSSKYCRHKYLKRSNQLPPWVFGYFYYHIFIIQNDVFLKAFNENITIIDSNKHGGCFYDAQIVLRLLATNTKMYFIDKLLTHIMIDNNSVACSFVGNETKADECIKEILLSDSVYKPFSSFFFQYKSAYKNLILIRKLSKTPEGRRMSKQFLKQMKKVIVSNNLKVREYFINYKKYKLIIFINSIPIVRRYLLR